MEQVILINCKPQTFFGNMYHDAVCRRAGACFCRQELTRSASGKKVQQKWPKGFHVFGKSQSEPLPKAVLYLEDVQAALQSGWLKSFDVPTTPSVLSE